uniref:Uncharacterized protein n=1 Tax=Anguilla anguilla TaxID=7936 RepID=A0A0E9WVH1_ANGAN
MTAMTCYKHRATTFVTPLLNHRMAFLSQLVTLFISSLFINSAN